MNQNEILYQCRLNNDAAYDKLFASLVPSIFAVYHEFKVNKKFVEIDEVFQSARIGVVKAVSNYREDKNVSFQKYAKCCIRREVYHAYIQQKRIKNKTYISCFSLDDPISEKSNNYIVDTISSDYFGDTERVVQMKLILEEISKDLGNDSKEYVVLQMRLEGYSYKEIAKKLNINTKRVDYLLSKTRKKIKYIKEDIKK